MKMSSSLASSPIPMDHKNDHSITKSNQEQNDDALLRLENASHYRPILPSDSVRVSNRPRLNVSSDMNSLTDVSLTSLVGWQDVKETTLAITISRQLHGVRVVSLTSCRPKPSFEKNKFLKKCSQSFKNEAIV